MCFVRSYSSLCSCTVLLCYLRGIIPLSVHIHIVPYSGVPRALLGHKVTVERSRPQWPRRTPGAYRQLAEQCWAHAPQDR